MLLGIIEQINIIPACGIPEQAKSLKRLFCFMLNIEPNNIEKRLTITIIFKILLFKKLEDNSLKKKNMNAIIEIFGMVLKKGNIFIGADSYVSGTQK